MKTIIQFSINREIDGGYIASAVGFPIFTQADTFPELEKNIVEATELFFEGENPADFGFVSHPSLMINMEISQALYA